MSRLYSIIHCLYCFLKDWGYGNTNIEYYGIKMRFSLHA